MKTGLSFVVAMACGLVGCGSSGSGNGTQSPSDAGGSPDSGPSIPDAGSNAAPPPADSGAPPDHGSPSTTYPAFAPSFGQIVNQGGTVMKVPTIIAITWDADPAQASLDSFADTIGSTSYWKETTSEYGISPSVSGAVNHVHLAGTPPATIQDADLQAMVQAYAGNADAGAASTTTDAGDGGGGTGDAGTEEWPAPTHDTIFAFFLPPSTSLQVQSMTGSGTQDACAAGEGGYHDQVAVGAINTSYAVVPSCTFPGSAQTAAQQTTMSMSHELVESATDPQPSQGSPTYLGFDGDHFSFDYFQEFQAEIGDACEFYKASFYEDKETTPAFDNWVQRMWSNASGTAGHDPCTPVPTGAYFNVTPLDLQDVAVTIPPEAGQLLPGLPTTTKGYKAAAGSSVTFAVGLYSDAATSGPWTLSVASGNPVLGSSSIIAQYNPSTVTATIDTTTGTNGQKAYVTVNVTSTGTLFEGEIVTITSTLGGVSHYMPVWIAGK